MPVERSHKQTGSPEPLRVQLVPVEQLGFDSLNPRLASVDRESELTQEQLLKILWSEMAVDEIALSIAANGYRPEEPLLVYQPNKRKQDFVVVEGNRRLAAVLLLRDETLRRKIRATDLPRLSEDEVRQLERLPVSIYEDRQSLWQYTGFRHISGARSWDSFSKAKYVAHVHEEYGEPLEKIARSIGDKNYLVKRYYRAYNVFKQAEAQAGFRLQDCAASKFYFSHLYTALDDGAFQNFLDITPEGSLKPNPVPAEKLDNLKELFIWLYGSKSRRKEPAVITQNPYLWRLQAVIKKRAALDALRSGLSLDRAYEISLGDAKRFRESLTRAKEELQQARGTVIGYRGEDDLYDVMERILELSDSLKTDMDAKRKTKSSSRR